MPLSESEAVDAARALINASHFERAIPILQDLNERNADTPLSNELLGYCHTELRHFRLAEFHYTLAADAESPTLAAVLGLADAYAYQHKEKEAVALLERIPTEGLNDIQKGLVYAARGNVASMMFKPQEAIDCYLKAIAAIPEDVPVKMWSNWLSLGHAYFEVGRRDLAEGAYEKAFSLSKNFWTIFHLSVYYHLTGRHQEACEMAEIRLLEPKLHHLHRELPNWDGKPCDTLVIFSEGGLGDVLLHTRYVTEAAKRCERVIFSTWEKLMPLVNAMRLGNNVEVVNEPAVDATMKRASLMSLPFYLGMFGPNDAPPATTLNISRTKKARPRVAVTWFGDVRFPHGTARDATLEDFEPMIRAHPEVEWVTFSPEDRAAEDIARLGLSDVLTQVKLPIEEAAVAMADCDLLVTVDTAHAHLASMVNVPVYMLVYKIPGVYWGLDVMTTPYYPEMVLFRQQTARSWQEPLESVNHAITAWLIQEGYLGKHPGAPRVRPTAESGGSGSVEECA